MPSKVKQESVSSKRVTYVSLPSIGSAIVDAVYSYMTATDTETGDYSTVIDRKSVV